MEKKLVDFPTHVVEESNSCESKTVVPVVPQVPVEAVYLSSEEGYRNFCEGCSNLVAVQETGSKMFPLHAFCSVGRCVK